MKIFLLDDRYRRVERFRRLYHPREVVHTASAEEAMRLLSSACFDLICLDHDLIEHDTDWISEGNGFEVAQFLGSCDTPNNDTLIVVHTMNPEAGARMMAALKSRRVRRVSIVDLFNPQLVLSLLEK